MAAPQTPSPAPAPLPPHLAPLARLISLGAESLALAWPEAAELHMVVPVTDSTSPEQVAVRDANGAVIVQATQFGALFDHLDPDTEEHDALEGLGDLFRAHARLQAAEITEVGGEGWAYLCAPAPAEEWGRDDLLRVAFILPTGPRLSVVVMAYRYAKLTGRL